MSDLYRPAAVTYASRRLDGEVLIGTPLSWRIFTGAGAIAVGFFLLFCAGATYTRKEQVTGKLIPEGGLVQLTSPISNGTVTLLRREGEVVAKGDVIAIISSLVSSQKIVAPSPGTLSLFSVQNGQNIHPGDLIASILPAHSLTDAELSVPLSLTTKFKIGAVVPVQIDTGASKVAPVVQATVLSIAQIPTIAAGAVTTSSPPEFRVRTRLDLVGHEDLPIYPGLPIKATVATERRSLLGWMLSSLVEP